MTQKPIPMRKSIVCEIVELTTSSSFGNTASFVSGLIVRSTRIELVVELAKWVYWTRPRSR